MASCCSIIQNLFDRSSAELRRLSFHWRLLLPMQYDRSGFPGDLPDLEFKSAPVAAG